MAEAENALEGRNEVSDGARNWTHDPRNVYRVNKSCDSCLRAKRKCDHKLPCSRCIGRGDGDLCTYSRRKPHESHKPHRSVKREGAAAALNAKSAPSSSGARMVRARFSPSPATGLVGMTENAYLGYFFGGVGFLPLTSQSHIREIIVKMMSTASGLSSMPDFDHPGDGFYSRNSIASSGLEWGVNRMVTGPSACILWSAIALGALAKGVPSEKVDVYLRLAKAEVHAFPMFTAEAVGCFIGTNDWQEVTEKWNRRVCRISRAWTILGYVHGFLGDKEEFSRCLKCADALLSACKESGSRESFPIGLTEIIKWDKALTMSGMSKENMQALSTETIMPPEMSSYPSEAEIYRYMVAFNRAIVQVFAQLSLSATKTAQRDGGESDGFDMTRLPQTEHGVDESEENRTKMIPPSPDIVWGKFKESSFELDILEQAVTHRSSVRDGAGGAMIYMLSPDIVESSEVFSAMLFPSYTVQTKITLLSVVAAGQHDTKGFFEKSRRVVDVFDRYPGLLRFVHLLHASHYLAAFLADTEDPEGRPLYEKLRAAYNPVRVSSLRAIPPFEEWQGISSICDDPACRMCEDYAKRLLNPVQCKQHEDTVQVDNSNAGAELLQGEGIPTPEPRPLPPNEGIRAFPHGEIATIEYIDVVSADGGIEFEMLSTLANAEPAALDGELLPQREESKLSRPPDSCLGVGTGREGDSTHADPIDIDSKMTHKVSSPLGYTENNVMDAAEETIDAEDWLEAINAEDWLEAIDAIHSSDQSISSLFTPVVHGKHESGGGAL